MTARLNGGSLVLAARNEHATAFATLSDQYRGHLFRAAHRITRTREDAEDAVQDSLLRAFVHMGDFEGRSNFGTWLTSITVDSALMILRKKESHMRLPWTAAMILASMARARAVGVPSLQLQHVERAPRRDGERLRGKIGFP